MSEEKTPLLTRISKELATLMDGHANREHVVLPFLHQLVAELPAADRIEALERENAALRDNDAKMQLLHRQEDQLIAAERKVAELEADKARLSEALRPFADMADYLDSETEGFADTDEFDLLYEDHLFHHFKVADFRAARAALSGSGSGWRE
jgi:hypothetical protein